MLRKQCNSRVYWKAFEIDKQDFRLEAQPKILTIDQYATQKLFRNEELFYQEDIEAILGEREEFYNGFSVNKHTEKREVSKGANNYSRDVETYEVVGDSGNGQNRTMNISTQLLTTVDLDKLVSKWDIAAEYTSGKRVRTLHLNGGKQGQSDRSHKR